MNETPHLVARCPKCREALSRDGSCSFCEAAASLARLRTAAMNFQPAAARRSGAASRAARQRGRSTWWMNQAKRSPESGGQSPESGAEQLPLAGQDAALPPSDRE